MRKSLIQKTDSKLKCKFLYLIASTILTFTLTPSAYAQDLDLSFGVNGTVTTAFPDTATAYSIAIQSDGKIVAVGTQNNNYALARYTTAGLLDTSFSGDGIVYFNWAGIDIAYSVAIQSDGKIVVAGTSADYFSLARYTTAGLLDTSFSGDGFAGYFTSPAGTAYSVAIQSDGKIVVAGFSNDNDNFALARYTTAGVLDTSFDGDGIVTTDFGSVDGAYSVAIQSDGKIVVAGFSNNDFALARYTTAGVLDTSFDGDGKVTSNLGGNDIGRSVVIQSDGKIVVIGGFSNRDFALARYTTTGVLDTSFSGDGMVTTDFGGDVDVAYSVAIQSDGKIVVAGVSNNDFALARYTTTGVLDTSFSGDGKVTQDLGQNDTAYSVAIQSDEKIVVAGRGNSKFALVRFDQLLSPAFTLSSSSESRTVNTAISGYTISSTGGTIASYAISPAAPAGLTFNTTTGLLSGTPTEVAAATAYTITATNTSGTAQRTFTLTVGPIAPAFTLSSSSESRTVNTAISGYTISSTGGTIASYAISPAAPAGLTFNTTTGLLSGTPTEVAASTAYTITATNATSSTTQTFTLTVTAVPVAPNDADNSAAQAAQAEAARRANEQRQMGDLSSVLPLINELIKEIEDGFKSTSAPKKKSSTSKTKQSSQAKPEKKSNSEPLTIPIPPATEPEAQSQVGELVSVSHKVGFGLSASWINSSNIKALRGFIAGIEESFEVERIVIQGYAQPTKIGLSDIDIARAKAVKKFLSKEGLDYPMIVEGMGQAKSKKGDLSRLAVVTVEGKLKNQN
jgi:uncharacterized delta-60 repeat protein